MKALFSIFSLTASSSTNLLPALSSAVTILKPLCPHFSLSDLSWQMENLFVSVPLLCQRAKIPKFGRKGEKFGRKGEKHNGAGVRLPPPRPVIKEFHPPGNIFFLHREEKISGKYCPQSPIIGPFANLFSHGPVFAQSTGGGGGWWGISKLS